MKIGMFGLGVVGSAVADLIRESRDQLESITGGPAGLATVVVGDVTKARTVDLSGITVTDDPQVILDDPGCDLVIEVMGGVGAAAMVVTEALRRRKTVVTANKELVATMRSDLVRAGSAGGRLFCEASVGAAIPVIRSMASGVFGLVSGVEAVINGTTNYVLERMAEGLDAEEALDAARRMGYAEADATDDITGRDAARKLSILAGLTLGANIYPDDIATIGIEGIGTADMEFGRRNGCRLRLAACAHRIGEVVTASVSPRFLRPMHPLYHVRGVDNGIVIDGTAGRIALSGPGAGGRPTAGAVCSDVISAARGEVGILDCLRRLVLSPRARVVAEDEPMYVRDRLPADALTAGLGERGFSILSGGTCADGAWVIGRGLDRMEIMGLLPSAVIAAWPGVEPVAEAVGV